MRGVTRPGAVVLFTLVAHLAFAADRIHYTISLGKPDKHLVQITIEIPGGQDSRELQLPVWNALYQVRDFSQYMNWIHAESLDGKPLPVTEMNKSRWKITGAAKGARVEYQMFSNDPGPYGAELNSHHAFFNLAELLCYVENEREAGDSVEFRGVPSGWKIATPLEQEQAEVFSAPNYDRLVDSPVEISAFDEADFETSGAKYRVIVDADDAKTILSKIVPPIQKIVSAETGWMDDRPFQTYTFIYHFADLPGDGGMEHAYSTAITLPARDVSQDLERFEGITAHEFFHLWNVKRIRPQSLEPIDYTKENYTPALWFSEGVDSTVAEYMLLRADLTDERHYLDHLDQAITELENRPAHLTQSVEQSSIDAWLEKYPYYRMPDRSISYYNKGELLGVLLDLKMRAASGDRASLKDLFRWMNLHYAKQGEFFPDTQGVRVAAEAVSHADLRQFFEKYVAGVGEVPWDEFFEQVGLRIARSEVTFGDPGFQAARNFDQAPAVLEVDAGSDAERAGLKAGDVIVGINGGPPGPNFEQTIAQLGPGTILKLRVMRDDAPHDLQWSLGSRKEEVFRLEDAPGISAQQKARREKWLFDNNARPMPQQ